MKFWICLSGLGAVAAQLIVFIGFSSSYGIVGATFSFILVLLVMTVSVAFLHAIQRAESRQFGTKVFVAIGYLLLVTAIFPRMGAAYYTMYNLRYEEGTFTTFNATRYGHQRTKVIENIDGGRIVYEYVEYGSIQKPHGFRRWHSPNGLLLREEQWTYGLRHGALVLYNKENGEVYVSGGYRHGRRHGSWKVYRDGEKLYASGEFNSGVPVDESWAYFDEKGNVRDSGRYKGEQQTFFRASQVSG